VSLLLPPDHRAIVSNTCHTRSVELSKSEGGESISYIGQSYYSKEGFSSFGYFGGDVIFEGEKRVEVDSQPLNGL
jgi:hypothetical protein